MSDKDRAARRVMNDAKVHAETLTMLAEDYKAEHSTNTANDLFEAVRLLTALSNMLKAEKAKPNAVDMLAVWEYLTEDWERMEKLPTEGALAHREYVIEHLTEFVNKWWEYAHNFLGFDDSYDWEFIPAFLGDLHTYDIDKLKLSHIGEAVGAAMRKDHRTS